MRLSKDELSTLLDVFSVKHLSKEIYEIESIPANSFLNENRFDLAFKLLYLRYRPYDANYSEYAYKEHIRAFSLGTFIEPGDSQKTSFKDYKDSFLNTFHNIQQNNFNPLRSIIPISDCGTILNGSHRIASSIFLNKSVSCVRLPVKPPIYNSDFFLSRSLPKSLTDIAAINYVNYSSNIYIAIVWPSAQGHDSSIRNILGRIVYHKSIKLDYPASRNFVAQIYHNEPWLGSPLSNFNGSLPKLSSCFASSGPLRVYLFHDDSHLSVLHKKNLIREIFGIGKHSIHITDTYEDAVRLSTLLFNDNSINFLHVAHYTNANNTIHLKKSIKSELASHGLSSQEIIFDTSLLSSFLNNRNNTQYPCYLLTENSYNLNDDLLLYRLR